MVNVVIGPVMLLTVPTATFAIDLWNGPPKRAIFVLRSLAEVFILAPFWIFLCVMYALSANLICP